MFDDLSKFNIVPNKSHTTESFCDNIEELIPFHLIKHFYEVLLMVMEQFLKDILLIKMLFQFIKMKFNSVMILIDC